MLNKFAFISLFLSILFLGGIWTYLASTDRISTPVAMAQNLPPGSQLDEESFMFDLGVITHEGIEGGTRQSWIRKGINYFFERIIGFMAGIIGTLAVLMLAYGGFMILASAGNENLYQKGMAYVKYSLIGLAVTLSAYILVTLVQLLVKSIYG